MHRHPPPIFFQFFIWFQWLPPLNDPTSTTSICFQTRNHIVHVLIIVSGHLSNLVSDARCLVYEIATLYLTKLLMWGSWKFISDILSIQYYLFLGKNSKLSVCPYVWQQTYWWQGRKQYKQNAYKCFSRKSFKQM